MHFTIRRIQGFAIQSAIHPLDFPAELMANSESLPYVLPYSDAVFCCESLFIAHFAGPQNSPSGCSDFSPEPRETAADQQGMKSRFIDEGCDFRRANRRFWIRRRWAGVQSGFGERLFLLRRPRNHRDRIPRTVTKTAIFDYQHFSSHFFIPAI